jgi:coronin-1B/1C/6
LAIPWAGGGGSIAIVPHTEYGKKAAELPVINGHAGGVLDFDFNPFNDYILASGSVDCTVKIWGIPEGGLKESVSEPLVTLDGHQKKVGLVQFHPTANNVLATACVGPLVKLWDIEKGACRSTIEGHKDTIQGLSFNRDGSQFVTTCKDKKLRIYDPRTNTAALETEGHQGTKGSRCKWMGKLDKIFTAGFTKLSERHYMIWDPKKMNEPIHNNQIDVSSGLLMPFFDEDTSVMYLAGKGDGNIRYYEMVNEDPYCHFLSEFKSNVPQRGMAMLPKVACDVASCEVTRLFKLTNNQVIPITFVVPRKSDQFQADIFPDTASTDPAVSAEEFFNGQNSEPKLTSMKPGENTYTGKGMKLSTFQPKVEKKEAPVALPPKTNDPKELLAQNEELRARVDALEKEKKELQAKVEQLQAQLAAAPAESAPASE